MFLDALFVLLMVLAAWKGYRQGLVVALFSFIAIVVGLAAAMKFSLTVAEWLAHHTSINSTVLPVLAFVVIILVVGLLIRIGAKLIQKGLQFALLGWVDKLGGIVLYALGYAIILSVIVFYSIQLKVVDEAGLVASKSYPFFSPLGPWFINSLGVILPFFKDMFAELQALIDAIDAK